MCVSVTGCFFRVGACAYAVGLEHFLLSLERRNKDLCSLMLLCVFVSVCANEILGCVSEFGTHNLRRLRALSLECTSAADRCENGVAIITLYV